jgi:hypothetical protein
MFLFCSLVKPPSRAQPAIAPGLVNPRLADRVANQPCMQKTPALTAPGSFDPP